MAETRAYLRALTLAYDDLGEILTLTNRVLAEDTDQEFVTLFLASFDPASRLLTYAGAGHEAHLLAPNGEVQRLASTSLPLGVEEELAIPCAPPIPLVPGQVILMTTDGLGEARDSQGNHFGTERCLQAVRENRDKSADEIVAVLRSRVNQFTQGRPQPDDITIVVCKVREMD
ncbi:MAG: PP2C family protein-serine/threonine phosphatase [Pirellulales bacterium]